MDQYVRENDLVEEVEADLNSKLTEKEQYWVITGYSLMLLAFWPHFVFPLWALVAKGLFFIFSIRKNNHVKLHVKRSLISQLPVSLFSFLVIYVSSTNLSGQSQAIFGIRGLLILGVLAQLIYLIYTLKQVKKVFLEVNMGVN